MIQIKTETIVTCDFCGSKDVESKKENYVHNYCTVLDVDSLRRRTKAKSVESLLKCHCNNCGKFFTESLGVKTFELAPYEVEV